MPNNKDESEFQKAMRQVRRITSTKVKLAPKTPKPITPVPKTPNPDLISEHTLPPEEVTGQQPLSFKRDGIQHKVLRNLSKGQYNVEAMLDLHGLKVDEAKKAVDEFLQECLKKKIHVALIIHGKGLHSEKPILKNKLNHWLRGIRPVLAFCSATVHQGHRGAVYILLKV